MDLWFFSKNSSIIDGHFEDINLFDESAFNLSNNTFQLLIRIYNEHKSLLKKKTYFKYFCEINHKHNT